MSDSAGRRTLRELQRYFPTPILSATRLRHDGNSLVYRIFLADRSCILKRYRPIQPDGYDRGATEFRAISFLRERGFAEVPRPIGWWPDANLAVYSFEDGRILTPREIREVDVLRLVEFIARIYELGEAEKAKFHPERTACLSLAAYIRAVERRRDAVLLGLETADDGDEARAFLEESLRPALEATVTEFLNRARACVSDVNEVLALSDQVITPGDFGLHNTLVGNGTHVFLDFEYFGRDDPVRHVLHFLHHDQTRRLPRRLKQLFLDAFRDRMACSNGFEKRLRLADPLVGLEWVLLYLNVLSESRRALATPTRNQAAKLLKRRLAKAKQKLGEMSYFT